MDTPAGGRQRRSFSGSRTAVLGSLTVPGSPEHVSVARKFVAQALEGLPGVDSEAATLLTSEVVTNAVRHTASGAPGGTVAVVVVRMPDGVLIEVTDEGSAGVPVVKGELLATEGHGLFLVRQMAAQWGYLRDTGGTTVWFHLVAADGSPEPEPRRQAALTASWTPAQIRARSSSPVTYGGMV